MNEFKPISRSATLKHPIKTVYGKENYRVYYGSDQVLKEIENEDIERGTIIEIIDKHYVYKKLDNNWYRKRKKIEG